MNAQNSNEFTNGASWIIDTGASHHLSHDVIVLTRDTPYECIEKIIVENGEGLEVKHIRNSNLQTQISCFIS